MPNPEKINTEKLSQNQPEESGTEKKQTENELTKISPADEYLATKRFNRGEKKYKLSLKKKILRSVAEDQKEYNEEDNAAENIATENIEKPK